MNLVNLSYSINEKTPSYGGRHKVLIEECESINGGDTANSFIINFYNHIGTHIDAPNHFYDNGKKINDYNTNELLFTKPQLVNVNLDIKNEISNETILNTLNKDADIIFFKTNFGKYRNTKKYIDEYPPLLACFANHLKDNYLNLRAIGLDIISLTSPLNKEEGKKSHQIFLKDDKPIFIIEDMNLDNYNMDIKKILVSPFNFEKIDSAPCNVYGII